jgi:hypothetical protein
MFIMLKLVTQHQTRHHLCCVALRLLPRRPPPQRDEAELALLLLLAPNAVCWQVFMLHSLLTQRLHLALTVVLCSALHLLLCCVDHVSVPRLSWGLPTGSSHARHQQVLHSTPYVGSC